MQLADYRDLICKVPLGLADSNYVSSSCACRAQPQATQALMSLKICSNFFKLKIN
jgi:hypothetical protein